MISQRSTRYRETMSARSYLGRTYYFYYDSASKHSMVDLPGIVVSERLMPAVSTGILLLPLFASPDGVKLWRRLVQTPCHA